MNKTVIAVVGIVIAIVAGCSKSTDPASGTTGTLQVTMVDSPAGYDQVNIVIDSVLVHVSTSDTTSGWTTLSKGSATYDLLKLVNGANAVIGNAKLPVGDYSQIRLYVGSGSNIVVGGVPKSLTTPGGSQSGIKLNVNATIQADVTYTLTIDFDANKSIVKSGPPNNPNYSLKPVIRAVATATTGNIAGAVLPKSTMPTVWAYAGLDTFSTVADTSGGFKLLYLSPATYSVVIASKDTLYRDTTRTNIAVTAGNTTNIGTITLTHK
jgi:hypothetical protein